MGQTLLKWVVVGILAGIWVVLYDLAGRHGEQGVLIISSIIGAGYFCKCNQREEATQNG